MPPNAAPVCFWWASHGHASGAGCWAVANAPRVLLADEPTGNLDASTADAVFRQLLGLVRETGMAALVATHNPELASRMDRTVTLKDGVLSG